VLGDKVRYFEWMGAAIFTADQRAGAMHGKQFLLDSVYAGIDGTFVYGRLDFAGPVPEMAFDLVVNLESWASGEARPRRTLRLDATVRDRQLTEWKVEGRRNRRPLRRVRLTRPRRPPCCATLNSGFLSVGYWPGQFR